MTASAPDLIATAKAGGPKVAEAASPSIAPAAPHRPSVSSPGTEKTACIFQATQVTQVTNDIRPGRSLHVANTHGTTATDAATGAKAEAEAEADTQAEALLAQSARATEPATSVHATGLRPACRQGARTVRAWLGALMLAAWLPAQAHPSQPLPPASPGALPASSATPAAAIYATTAPRPARLQAAAQPAQPVQPTRPAPAEAAPAVAAPGEAPLPDAAFLQPATLELTVGHVVLLPLAAPVSRVVVGDPKVADYRLVSPTEIYVLGKAVGSTNLVLWHKGGAVRHLSLGVGLDTQPLLRSLRRHLPAERDLQAHMHAGSVVLSGEVSTPVATEAAVSLAEAFMRPVQPQGAAASSAAAAASRVVNLLRTRSAQQVLLEVRVAEVSKALLERLGVGVQAGGSEARWSVVSDFLGGGGGAAGLLFGPGRALQLEAEKKDGLVRILAEPTIVASSGKEGSFLVGGKVFIPVAQSTSATGTSITLDEREYGVGLKFVPTVLEGGRIALKVATEVSEIAKESLGSDGRLGSGVLPMFTTRRVGTSVQLSDGQSLVIGGLLRQNLSASTRGFPLLSELPVLGALFRSNQYASDQTELVVAVRARLAQAVDAPPPLPTDSVAPPTRRELFLENRLQGARPTGAAP